MSSTIMRWLYVSPSFGSGHAQQAAARSRSLAELGLVAGLAARWGGVGAAATGAEAVLPADAGTNPGVYMSSASCAPPGNRSAVGNVPASPGEIGF
jgi:hypothetical protein